MGKLSAKKAGVAGEANLKELTATMHAGRPKANEVKNLAASPAHQATLVRLRAAQKKWALEIRDIGFLSEAEIHSRSKGSTPYECGHDRTKYPFERVFDAAEKASLKQDTAALLHDPDSAVRYWAVTGFIVRGKASAEVLKLLDDPAPAVRVATAECVGRYGTQADLQKCLDTLMAAADPSKNGVHLSVLALNAIDTLGKKAAPLKAALQAMPKKDPAADPRMAEYVPRLTADIVAGL